MPTLDFFAEELWFQSEPASLAFALKQHCGDGSRPGQIL